MTVAGPSLPTPSKRLEHAQQPANEMTLPPDVPHETSPEVQTDTRNGSIDEPPQHGTNDDDSLLHTRAPHPLALTICDWLEMCEQSYDAPPPDNLPMPIVNALGPDVRRAVAKTKLSYLLSGKPAEPTLQGCIRNLPVACLEWWED